MKKDEYSGKTIKQNQSLRLLSVDVAQSHDRPIGSGLYADIKPM
jgi:hypothetical protein